MFKESADVKSFVVALMPMAAEAAEFDLVADGRVLPYSEKSGVARNLNFKINKCDESTFLNPRDNFWWKF